VELAVRLRVPSALPEGAPVMFVRRLYRLPGNALTVRLSPYCIFLPRCGKIPQSISDKNQDDA
jgi:hypothetical protein